MDRKSSARWNGDLRSGNGTMRLGSGAFEGPFSFGSRFENAPGTNPEELVGAALAGCFSMALAAGLVKEGKQPKSVETSAVVHLEKDAAGFSITGIDLTTNADVPGLDPVEFQKAAEATKTGCIMARALKAVPIHLNATLATAAR